MKWIAHKRRLAIYRRDNWRCLYCFRDLKRVSKFLRIRTLDHITPVSKGGSHKSENLIMCCKACNDSRGSKPVEKFASAEALQRIRAIQAEVKGGN